MDCDNYGMQARCNPVGNPEVAVRAFLRISALLLAVGGLLAGCASTGPVVSDAARSIVLVHPASGESLASVYWRSDGYDQQALADLALLFRDRRTGEVAPVDPALIDMLVELRQRLGLPEAAPIHLTSGYRSPVTNASLAKSSPHVAENSYHIRGQAADIRIPGVPSERVAEAAAAMRRGGYALYAHSGHVHVDTGPYRTWAPKYDPRPERIVEAKAPARPPETKAAASGLSKSDQQRLGMILANLAAEDASTGKAKRQTAVR